MPTNDQIFLVSRPAPHSKASTDNFKFRQSQTPELQLGQVLVRHHYLSLDPYMRGRMNDNKSYAPPQPLGEVMLGGTVGDVVESCSDQFKPGDKVVGMGGWQLYSVAPADALRKVDDLRIPLSVYLGAVGMPGVAAWYGLTQICKPKSGQTVAVSAASGAVGSVVGQLAKLHGCRVVGIAGGAAKCQYVVDELGFDACVDYKAHANSKDLYLALKAATPSGIDGYFENVGGAVLDAALSRMNPFGRIALCGMIAGYEREAVPLAHPALILVNRLRLEGFIVTEHQDLWPQALSELSCLVVSGQLKCPESMVQGLEAAPQAFLDLLTGKNFGKQLVRLV